MATVLLVGFGHPDSARLVSEMRASAPQHDFTEPADDLPETAKYGSAVALIWCPRSPEDAAAAISGAVAKGLPAVALLQDSKLPSLDLSKGHIEVTFAPAECKETLRRIDLVMVRASGPADHNLIKHGDLEIDQDRYEVRLSGRKVDLTYKEYELLKYIAARPGRVFSREALLRAVWDYDYFGGTRTVDVHVRRLRSKINDVRYQFIETVWNVGYRFRSTGDSPDA